MSKRDLQKDIRKGEGYILSDGTLNLQHLLPKAYDVIKGYNLQGHKELLEDILSCFSFTPEGEDMLKAGSSLFEIQYWGHLELKEDEENRDKQSFIWCEDIYNLFNNLAPARYSFGSSEGDGALIGWFRYEEEVC